MIECSLKQFVDENGQTMTASKLGLTQGAIWQMIRSGRQITVVKSDLGYVSAYEKKVVGRPSGLCPSQAVGK